MGTKILDNDSFARMMKTSLDGCFYRQSVEAYCRANNICFDLGHYWDCVWEHRHNASIEERPSGIFNRFTIISDAGSAFAVDYEMHEFKFKKDCRR